MLKLNSKPAISIFLGHLSPNRVNKDAQETNKLELLLSFAKLRSVIEDELECVVIQRGSNIGDDNPQVPLTHINFRQFLKK
jgi:hypothetical protein